MELRDLFDYKNKLMQELCTNKEIVTLLTDKAETKVPNHKLAYTQIFPYEFIPETIDQAQTLMCFDVDIVDVDNKTFYTPVIYIWVFAHKSLLRLPQGGIRLDRISEEIDKMLNGSRIYGLGELNLHSVTRFSPIDDYQGRVLTYYTRDFNRRGSKPVPVNRKHP